MQRGDEDVLLEILRAPICEERPWMVFGACRDMDPDLFFPQSSHDARAATAVCRTCAVRTECLEYSLEARESFGVWGGLTEKQRRQLLRRSA